MDGVELSVRAGGRSHAPIRGVLACCAAALILAACGGGGGGGGGGGILPSAVQTSSPTTTNAGMPAGSSSAEVLTTSSPPDAPSNPSTTPSTTPGATAYSVSGSVTGLVGTLVLQNAGGEKLTLASDGTFQFASRVPNGNPYAVTVVSQPTTQTCTVNNGAGTSSSDVSSISVVCSTLAYSVGGNVAGLLRGTLELRNNSDILNITANGPFRFASQAPAGSAYSISVRTQPAGQTCTVSNAAGSIAGPVTSIAVNCAENTASAPPSAPQGIAIGYGVKSLTFTWAASPGATYYQLLDDAPLGNSAFALRADDLINTNYQFVNIDLALLANPNFVVSACNAAGCTRSAPVTPDMGRAIGYFKGLSPFINGHAGQAVAVSGDGRWLAVGSPGFMSETGIVYVFARDDFSWRFHAALQGSNSESGDKFGTSLALSKDGSVLAIGAEGEAGVSQGGWDVPPNDNSTPGAGAVYVFRNGASGWVQEAYLKNWGAESARSFGHSVAISDDGSLIVAGAPGDGLPSTPSRGGAVTVYAKQVGHWWALNQAAAPTRQAGSLFGWTVALSGDGSTLTVGARTEYPAGTTSTVRTSPGAVYVFNQPRALYMAPPIRLALDLDYADFGFALSLSKDGKTLAVGAPAQTNVLTGDGAAYVFAKQGDSSWTREAFIKPESPSYEGSFGYSVSLSRDGSVLAIGSPGDYSTGRGISIPAPGSVGYLSGAVQEYRRDAGGWTKSAFIKAPNPDPLDRFGWAVSVSDDGATLAVGAFAEGSSATGINGDRQDNSVTGAGAAYLY